MVLFNEICDLLEKSVVIKNQAEHYHAHCAQLLEDALAQVECFQTIAYPMKHGGIWQVDLYFSSGDVPVEWFGSACCSKAATAMALMDFAE